MNRIIIIILSLFSTISYAQNLKPGFDLLEFKEVFKINVKSFYPKECLNIPESTIYTKQYESPSMGLDNKWELWTSEGQKAVISIRGSTAEEESWLANAYAVMVPAKGSLHLGKTDTFEYQVAKHPQAAVHLGWLISMAYLSRDILPQIDSCYRNGIKDFYITGHSQGGGISFLMTAYLRNLQSRNIISKDIQFKTYCSAGPKPGNLYFAYDYSLQTQDGWAYNVINPNDWVVETFLTVQTIQDLNKPNIFESFKGNIGKEKLFKRMVYSKMYKNINKPSQKTQKRYSKYFGNYVGSIIHKYLPQFTAPQYFPTSNYTQAGNLHILKDGLSYFENYPSKTNLMEHHQPEAYYYLIKQEIAMK